MQNIVPTSAVQILEKALDIVKQKTNANGEIFGGEIMDAMREAGKTMEADRLEILLTRTVLVRAMESLREEYPAEVLQNYETRMRVSQAVLFLREAIDSIRNVKGQSKATGSVSR